MPTLSQRLPLLPHPWDLLILLSGKSISLRVSDYLRGSIMIQQRDGSPPKQIAALRLWAERLDHPSRSPYYDVTYTRLIEALVPFLDNPATSRHAFTMTAGGQGNRKTFTLDVSPN
jgi:hypothetical protein